MRTRPAAVSVRHTLRSMAAALLVGAALVALLSQIPARHPVDIGGYDAAYVQGFHDPQYHNDSSPAYLDGSDGRVRWSRARSFLLFPQAGLPATLSLRVRGWRPPGAASPDIEIVLNGRTRLGRFQTSNAWQDIQLSITKGAFKPDDVVIEIRTLPPATLPDEGREVGVLLDRATYRVAGERGLITPYPVQMGYGALACGLLWLWLGPPGGMDNRRRWWRWAALVGVGGLLFLVVYRLQPPFYPYPLRWFLPLVNGGLLALLAVRHAPGVLVRWPALADVLALVGIAVWVGGVLLAAEQHVTLSVPGVEKDFRVYATRAPALAEVFKADGFYNLGYPLLLWLVAPLTQGNAFVAARVIAALSGGVLLGAGYALARGLLAAWGGAGRVGALVALVALAFSPLVVRYALYIGSDMPFAALVALVLALFVIADTHASPRWRLVLLALCGAAAGGAFLVRHAGMVLLPWGIAAVWLCYRQRGRGAWITPVSAFVVGFVLLVSPQLVVNMRDTGHPLYSQQAKNVWLAVYGNVDWGRWDEVPNSIPLREVILRDPPRFALNWWHNLVAFAGVGAEETGETGRALQLRLLAWPANWLAVAGVLCWLVLLRCAGAAGRWRRAALLLFLLLYVAAACIAFVLPRYFLPLAPLYAAAAAWLVVWLGSTALRGLPCPDGAPPPFSSYGAINRQSRNRDTLPTAPVYRRLVLVGGVLLLLLHGGFGVGTRAVLEQQPADEVAIIRLVDETLPPGARVVALISPAVPIAKYSAIAHRVAPLPDASDERAALERAQQQGIDYVLWDGARGPPPLPDAGAAVLVGRGGRYELYRLDG